MYFSRVSRSLIMLSLVLISEGQNIRQQINDICRTLIINKYDVECFDDNIFLSMMDESKRILENDILLPLRRHYNIVDEHEDNLTIYLNKLLHISNMIRSIECKKAIKKKGVLRKIKKFATTAAPVNNREEEEEEWDGWTLENLKLMKEYYEEMQQELEEIRKLVN